MINKGSVSKILDYIETLFPDAGCELEYHQDYELAIAVMLSAQTTDKKVNAVTRVLFHKYQTLESLAIADVKDIENIIKTIGLYRNKAKNVVLFSQKLLTDFNGILPSDKEHLTTLPGIGNKSAGVIRAEVFKIPDLAVDTHILRVSQRLGIMPKGSTPDATEKRLKELIKKERWIKAHHLFIHFGRYFCTARSPKCSNCVLKGKYCHYSEK
ncbi:MAG: endonuclease III [Coprobacillus sp.]|nr:endonuclease III [Coprobacillus sp.]